MTAGRTRATPQTRCTIHVAHSRPVLHLRTDVMINKTCRLLSGTNPESCVKTSEQITDAAHQEHVEDLLGLTREEGNIASRDYVWIVFPYSRNPKP